MREIYVSKKYGAFKIPKDSETIVLSHEKEHIFLEKRKITQGIEFEKVFISEKPTKIGELEVLSEDEGYFKKEYFAIEILERIVIYSLEQQDICIEYVEMSDGTLQEIE